MAKVGNDPYSMAIIRKNWEHISKRSGEWFDYWQIKRNRLITKQYQIGRSKIYNEREKRYNFSRYSLRIVF